MDKKISTLSAVLVILLIAGFFAAAAIAAIYKGLDFYQEFLLKEQTIGKQNTQVSQFNKMVEEKNEAEARGLKVVMPEKGEVIKSPLVIWGEAKGGWFFEGDFPLKLIDGEGHLLAAIPAVAKGEWMTENWVPFEAILDFSQPETAEGFLLFEKNNPSGMPENGDSFSLPIKFFKK